MKPLKSQNNLQRTQRGAAAEPLRSVAIATEREWGVFIPPLHSRSDAAEESPHGCSDAFPRCEADYSEWCWSQLDEADYTYLTASRVAPSPCPWCGGRLAHGADCQELHLYWASRIKMRWGKHRGRRLPDVPAGYLTWQLRSDRGDSEFRKKVAWFLTYQGVPLPAGWEREDWKWLLDTE